MNNKRPEGGLLQSQEWINVLQEEKKKIIDLIVDDDHFFGVVQKLPIVGKYIYFSRIKDISDSFVKKICELDFGWIRVDIDSEQDFAVLKKCGKKIVKAPHDMQPKEHLIIDITKSDDEILAQMKSKTRYNVRLAQKKNVQIVMSKEREYADVFYRLVEKTAQRKNVTFHERAHYEKMLRTLPDDMIALYSAEYDGQIIAANLVSYYGGTATYLHGATADAHRNVMAPFLLQWEIIQDAKKRECEWYDFGGVFPGVDEPGKKGITRFKKGFAPQESLYITKGSYDIVLSPRRYFLYKSLQRLRQAML